jgi:phosphoribosylformylglycinamidine (FGAM) synthase-like amidotransferase family enzyme
MASPLVLILRAPGTNCDLETAHAFETAGARTERIHIHALLREPDQLRRFQVLCLPGGFSYGDDIASGRILGNKIRHDAELSRRLAEFKDQGKLILGICNGFQILIKSGILLPPDQAGAYHATLTNNESGKFEDRWVHLAVPAGKCVFFAGIERMYLPVAHAEGKFVTRDEATLRRLRENGQVALTYVECETQNAECRMISTSASSTESSTPHSAPGTPRSDVSYPSNPNGSQDAVAGICDETGRVCGIMPHPERHIDRTHHPRWTRGKGTEEGDGLRVFRNAVNYFE